MFLWKASGVFNPVLATKSKWVISLVGNCFFPHMSDNSKYIKILSPAFWSLFILKFGV